MLADAATIARGLRDVRVQVASREQLDAALDCGIDPAHVQFDCSLREISEIAAVAWCGVRRFVLDSRFHLELLRRAAPAARALVRLPAQAHPNAQAQTAAEALIGRVRLYGLDCAGVVVQLPESGKGRPPAMAPLAAYGALCTRLAYDGVELPLLQVDGPWARDGISPDLETLSEAIMRRVRVLFPYAPDVAIAVARLGDAGAGLEQLVNQP